MKGKEWKEENNRILLELKRHQSFQNGSFNRSRRQTFDDQLNGLLIIAITIGDSTSDVRPGIFSADLQNRQH